jgi:hypothetical protein
MDVPFPGACMMSISNLPTARSIEVAPRRTEPFPVLDLATVVGGAFLSATGLARGGIRGWLSSSLGTLLVYRGVLSLQEYAARQCVEGHRAGPGELLTGAKAGDQARGPFARSAGPDHDPLEVPSHSVPRNTLRSATRIEAPL